MALGPLRCPLLNHVLCRSRDQTHPFLWRSNLAKLAWGFGRIPQPRLGSRWYVWYLWGSGYVIDEADAVNEGDDVNAETGLGADTWGTATASGRKGRPQENPENKTLGFKWRQGGVRHGWKIIEWDEVGWDGDGMRWDEDGMGWDGMRLVKVWWDGLGVGWDGTRWDDADFFSPWICSFWVFLLLWLDILRILVAEDVIKKHGKTMVWRCPTVLQMPMLLDSAQISGAAPYVASASISSSITSSSSSKQEQQNNNHYDNDYDH